MKRILPLLLILFITPQINNAQQIGDGWAVILNNFNNPLMSGVYNGLTSNTLIGSVPDLSHPWQYLFTIRHPNGSNNHQLQLGASFAQNDRLFFRKIAVGSASDGNSNWIELASRGANTFMGSQVFKTNGQTYLTIDKGDNGFEGGINYSKQGIPIFYIYSDNDGTNDLKIQASGLTGEDDSHPRVLFPFANKNILFGLSGGNVGIGTTTPKNALDVNGTIRAKEVKVETGWADFVFAPTYKLRPLSEIEQFIKTNGHLPEIPKAEEVQQNGVNLGEMQTKLLQKVEELTLYSIELKKENIEQSKENDRLKAEIKELKDLLTHLIKKYDDK